MGLNFSKLSTFVSIALVPRSLKNDFTRLAERDCRSEKKRTRKTPVFTSFVHVSGNCLRGRFDARWVQAKSKSTFHLHVAYLAKCQRESYAFACVLAAKKSVQCSQSDRDSNRLGDTLYQH